MYGFIYITTNLINNKQYVGKRVIKNNKNDKDYLGSGKILKQAILKEGKENFSRQILVFCIDELELRKYEASLIRSCKTLYPGGYNIAKKPGGGDNLTNHPDLEAIKNKMKLTATKRDYTLICTEERNKKISLALTGRVRSAAERRNNSAGQKKPGVTENKQKSRYKNNNGIWHTEEAKKKIGAGNKGKSWSEEVKKAHGEKLKGRPRPETEVTRLKEYMTDPVNKIPCDLCGKLLNKNNYKQHRNKCKNI